MTKGWFVIQVYTGYEKTVFNGLQNKRYDDVLKDVILDIRVPEEEYTVEKRNKKVKKKRKIYPGYVLVEMELPDTETGWKQVYAEIKSVTGVGMFLTSGGGNKKPSPLNLDEVRSIFEKTGDIKSEMGGLEAGYEVGESVRIGEGPFKGFEGKIEEIYGEKNSLMVRVEIFGRLTPVELAFNQVTKV